MTRRALFVTPYSPLPMVNGGSIRTFNLMARLAEHGWHPSLFSLVTRPVPAAEQRVLEELCQAVVLEPRTIPRVLSYCRIVRDVLRSTAYLRDYYWLKRAGERLERWLRRDPFDVIFLSHLHMYRYLPDQFRSMAVLDTQNAEALRLNGVAAARGLALRGLVSRLQGSAVRRFEGAVVRSVARTLAVSGEDYGYFQTLAPGRVHLVPNGVDLECYQPRRTPPTEPRLLFMGSMWYHANVDAVRYLVRDVLPRVRSRDAQLVILGANPTSDVFSEARRSAISTEVTGYVEDARPYVASSRMLVVPLRYGGGTRLKILEALAQGLPVVSSSVGCAGLRLSHERDIIVADEPADQARWIDRLLEDDDLCASLAREGRATVEREYGWKAIAARLHEILTEVSEGVAA